MAMNAFSQAIVAFVSQNVGAKKYERINKIVVTTWICASIVGIVLGNGVYLLGKPLLGLYSGNGEVIDAGIRRLAVICTTYALCGMMDCMVGALRGIAYSVMPMKVSLLGVCAFRMVWILGFFQIKQFHIIDTVYLAYPISWLLTFIVHVICYLIVRRKIDNLE